MCVWFALLLQASVYLSLKDSRRINWCLKVTKIVVLFASRRQPLCFSPYLERKGHLHWLPTHVTVRALVGPRRRRRRRRRLIRMQLGTEQQSPGNGRPLRHISLSFPPQEQTRKQYENGCVWFLGENKHLFSNKLSSKRNLCSCLYSFFIMIVLFIFPAFSSVQFCKRKFSSRVTLAYHFLNPKP